MLIDEALNNEIVTEGKISVRGAINKSAFLKTDKNKTQLVRLFTSYFVEKRVAIR